MGTKSMDKTEKRQVRFISCSSHVCLLSGALTSVRSTASFALHSRTPLPFDQALAKLPLGIGQPDNDHPAFRSPPLQCFPQVEGRQSKL